MAAAWVKDVQQDGQTVNSNQQVVTLTAGVAQNDTLVVHCRRTNSADTLASVTDSRGNAYHVDHSGATVTGSDRHALASGYMTTALQVGDTVTITWTNAAASNFFSACLVEYSGIASANWWDTQAAAGGFGTAVNSGNAGASTADGIVFGAICADGTTDAGGSTFTATNSFNKRTVFNYHAETLENLDKAGTSGTVYAATGTLSGNQNWHAIVQNYKVATPAPTPPNGLIVYGRTQGFEIDVFGPRWYMGSGNPPADWVVAPGSPNIVPRIVNPSYFS